MKRRWSVLTRFSIFPEASTRSSGNHSILSRWLLAALAVTTFHRNFYQAWKSESEKIFFLRALACRWQLSAWIYAKPGKGKWSILLNLVSWISFSSDVCLAWRMAIVWPGCDIIGKNILFFWTLLLPGGFHHIMTPRNKRCNSLFPDSRWFDV